jgi:cyclopropane-fatty-acyl-phospholipid synthase
MFTRNALRGILRRFIRRDSVAVTTADSVRATFGDATGEHLEVRFLTRAAEIRTRCHPELAFGEAFMAGDLVVEQGDIAGLLAILMDHPAVLPGWAKVQWWARCLFRRLRQHNRSARSRRNVAHQQRPSCFW